MHLPCENTDRPCPVIFPVTCPPPRCDCREDLLHHCFLCHLPFDIESRLRPYSGLRVFCSCFVGESRVLFHYPTVCWMPVFYWIPTSETPDSGRSSLSSVSNHSVPPTVNACLNELTDSSRKHSTGETTAECDNRLPNNTIEDCSDEFDHSLPKDCFVDSTEFNQHSPKSEALGTLIETKCPLLPQDDNEVISYECDHRLPKNTIEDCTVEFYHSLPKDDFVDLKESVQHSSKSRVLDILVETKCPLLPQDDNEANNCDRTFLSEEVIQTKDSDSPKTMRDDINPTKGIFTELKHITIPTTESLSVRGSLDFASSHSEGKRFCKNENLNAPVFSEANNLKESREIFCPAFKNMPELVDRTLLAQVPRDKGKESTSFANVTEPFTTAGGGNFSTKLNQNCQTSYLIMEEAQREKQKPLFVDTNYFNLNSSESNTSCLGNRFVMNTSAEPLQSFASMNASYSKNNVKSKYKFSESWYSPNKWNVSGSNTTNSLADSPLIEPSHFELTLSNSIETKSNCANIYNYEKFRIPTPSHVAQEHYPLRYTDSEIPVQNSPMFEISSQHHAVNVSSGNELKGTSVQSNRMSNSYQTHWSGENSSVHPVFDPRGNFASSNACASIPRHGFANDFNSRNTGNRNGFLEGSDLIQEIMKTNAVKNNLLQELLRKQK